MRRGPVLVFAFATLAAAATLVACRSGGETAAVRAPGDNVLLISIDTLRADHLGCYGHPTIKTPNIDRLAAEGALFEQCTSSAPLTLPSHSTMLTGTQPYVHGARDNGHFYLHESNVTLAERLRDAGYTTLADVAAYVLNHEFGIAQGFDVYEDINTTQDAVGVPERPGDEVCDAALELLNGHQRDRFFLFVHFYDPHFPYASPPPYSTDYADPYLGEIAFVDAQIGRLMDELTKLGLDENTLVVLVSDHGESLGQHHEQTHGIHVYDATTHVPMIWRRPGKIAAGQRLGMQVRLVDVTPTVLDFVGLNPLKSAQGVSLLPQLTGTSDDPHLAAYSESMMPLLNWGYAAPRALRQNGWAYIHAEPPQLYHVAVDPQELTNLAAAEPKRVEQMRDELTRRVLETPSVIDPSQAQRQSSSADLERLAALGYAGGEDADAESHTEAELLDSIHTYPDSSEHADEIDRMQAALRDVTLHDFPNAEKTLREVIELRGEAADIPWVYENLALSLAQQNRHDEAVESYRRAIAIEPDNGTTLTNYALSLIELNQPEDAASILDRALQLKPVLPVTHEAYGLALHKMGRIDEASEQFRLALEISPESPQISARLARVLLEAGRGADAVRDLEPAVRHHPDLADLRELLAEAYLRTGKSDAAVNELQEVVKLDPQRAPAWQVLAFAHIRGARWSQAADALRRAAAADSQNSKYVNDLAWLLATCPDEATRNGDEALRLAERAAKLRGDADANVLDTRAAALAELGRFDEAIAVVNEAIAAADTAGNAKLSAQIEQRRALYAQQKPYRLSP